MPELSTPPALTLETILLRREDIPTIALSETEVVMLHMDRGTYFGMEDVAKFIWEALAEPTSVSGLCDSVMTRYGVVERAACERDTLAFLHELMKEDLVDVRPSMPTASTASSRG